MTAFLGRGKVKVMKETTNVIRIWDLTIYLDRKKVFLAGEVVPLSDSEFENLKQLVTSPNWKLTIDTVLSGFYPVTEWAKQEGINGRTARKWAKKLDIGEIKAYGSGPRANHRFVNRDEWERIKKSIRPRGKDLAVD